MPVQGASSGPERQPGVPLRVAIDGRVIGDHFPGIGRYVYHLADALAGLVETPPGEDAGARDLEILLVHRPGQSDARYDLAALGAHPSLRLVEVDAPVFGPSSQWRIPRALRRERADLWHATYWMGAWRAGRPTVLTLYDLIGRRLPGSVPGLRARLLSLALRQALRGAEGILTISEAARRDILAETGPGRQVVVTPLAADARFGPRPAAEVEALRGRLDLPPRYALYLGINKPHKNLVLLVEAWARLAEAHPELVTGAAAAGLVIAGRWDPRYPEARERAEHLPEAHRPRFLGPVDEADLPALYTGASLFAFPSRYEGFGLPPLEAMACGAPVLAADATSLPEVVGEAGLLLPPEEPEAWAHAMARLLGDSALARDLARRGIDRAAGFSWRETARRTLRLYHRVAGR